VSRTTLFFLFATSIASTGCELSLTPSISPTLDTTGAVGVEGRLEFGVAFGAPSVEAMAAIGPGGGYNRNMGGYFTHESIMGAQFGDVMDPDVAPAIRGRAAFTSTIRAGERGPTRLGLGGVLDLMFGVGRTKHPFGIFLLGPHFQAEGILPDDAFQERAIFGFGLVAQWIFVASQYGPTPRIVPNPPPPPPAPSGTAAEH
jgi:hypothetical protein